MRPHDGHRSVAVLQEAPQRRSEREIPSQPLEGDDGEYAPPRGEQAAYERPASRHGSSVRLTAWPNWVRVVPSLSSSLCFSLLVARSSCFAALDLCAIS